MKAYRRCVAKRDIQTIRPCDHHAVQHLPDTFQFGQEFEIVRGFAGAADKVLGSADVRTVTVTNTFDHLLVKKIGKCRSATDLQIKTAWHFWHQFAAFLGCG